MRALINSSMEDYLSTSVGPNTPDLKQSAYSFDTPISFELGDRMEIVERRLEKAERMLTIGEELAKLKQDLDEIRQAEWLRRLEDLEERVSKIEQNHSSFLISLEAKVESNSLKLDSMALPSLSEELSQMKQDLQQITMKTRAEGLLKFEKDFQTQLFSVCLTLEEIASITHRTEVRQQELETAFAQLNTRKRQGGAKEDYTWSKKRLQPTDNLEDEEFFLKAVSTQ
jgi:chromosome segregation ATPase